MPLASAVPSKTVFHHLLQACINQSLRHIYRTKTALCPQSLPPIEPLEQRRLLAVPPIITEFLASNHNGLQDIQGDTSDWIEIYNPNTTAINLQGYKLINGPTDDPMDRTEWVFPSTPLNGNSYAIVYASGKVPAPAGQPLHASFELDGDGEYLALADPAGNIVSEFSPGYPEQRSDISYGLQSATPPTTTHLTLGSSLKTTVPTNDTLALDWTNRLFNDATWTSGANGLGFETNIGASLPNETESNNDYTTANDASANFAPLTGNLYHMAIRGESLASNQPDFFRIGSLDVGDILTIALSGAGSSRGSMGNSYVELYRRNNNVFNPVLVASNDDGGPGGNTDSLIHRLTIANADTYYVKVRPAADPGGTYDLSLWLENTDTAPTTTGTMFQESEPNDSAYAADNVSASWRATEYRSRTRGTAGSSDDHFKFRFTAGDLITVYLDSTGAAGAMDASVYLLDSSGQTIASDDGSSSASSPYNDDAAIYAYRIPATGIYYVRMQTNSGSGSPVYNLDVYLTSSTPPPTTAAYSDLIKTNIEPQMAGKNSTAYVRFPFHVDDVSVITSLTLRMKYDDGYAAYINGQLVATRNAPDTLTYNSAATSSRTPSQAIVFEDVDISAFKTALVVGDNVLAIHGLNASNDNSTFLILPELVSTLITTMLPQYYATPTPGQPNREGTLGLVADTKFDHDRGFYNAPFDLTLSTSTEGAQIRYTLDGKAPTATTGLVYTQPIRIAATTTIRAAAFKAGYVPTNVDTQTYLFLDDVIRQSPTGSPPSGWPSSWGSNVVNYGMDPDIVNNAAYKDTIKNDLLTIPTYSIVMDLNDLFSPTTGIYANPSGEGKAWERPMSLELIYPDGSKGFQENGGIRIRGGYSRSTANPKHAFRLFFRDEYGAGKLKFPVFGPDGPREFDCFDLRTFQNYSWSFDGDSRGVFIRDVFSRDTQLAMGSLSERGDYCHLYINGQYWGLYNTCERPEASWAASYLGGSPDDYDVIKVEAGPYTINATDGDMAAWTRLWNAAKAGLSSDAAYFKIQGRNPDGSINPAYENLLDVDNLIDYMLVILYGGNLDAPISNFLGNTNPNNFYAYRKRDGTAGGFRFVAHDSEHTLLNVNENRMGPYSAGNTLDKSNPQWLWQQCMANAEFRLKVADHVHKAFFNGGVFYVDPVNSRWDPEHPEQNVPAARFMARKNEIDRAVVGESARWGDSKVASPLNRNSTWVSAVNTILNSFFPQRSAVVLSQLKAKQLYPTVNAPTFSQFGGTITSGFALSITAGSGTIYYTLDGSDPRSLGGAVAPTALTYSNPIPLNQTTNVKARLLSGGVWSALVDASFSLDMSALRVTEVMYDPQPPDAGPFPASDFEFVEIQNTGAATIDILGARLTNAIDFTFNSQTLNPADRYLPPGQRIVVVKNSAAFLTRYGNTTPDGNPIRIAGPYDGKLDNAGETLQLEGPLGQLIQQFTYNNSWLPLTNGQGFSMVAVDPLATNAVLSTKPGWRPSSMPLGSPGADDPGLNPDSLVINEIMSHPIDGGGTWIELLNTTPNDINISGWFVSNASDNLTLLQLPQGTIVPGNGFRILTNAELGFAFNPLGGQFHISSNYNGLPGGYRESALFGPAEPGVTFGRYTKTTGKSDFVAMSAVSRNQPNAYPLIGPVVINEIMYHPTAGNLEYIELLNLTSQTLPLYDPAHPQNTWKFTSGLQFAFAPGDEIPANAYVLVVPIDPQTFRLQYDIPAEVPIFGPYLGVLNGAGEPIELSKPAEPQSDGTVPYILVERIKYDNKFPWPTKPDGTGPSLARLEPASYGNDSVNWVSDFVGGTPGRENRGQVLPQMTLGASSGVVNVGFAFNRNASFTDPNEGQTWTATVDWDEGAGPEPLPLNPDQTFKLSHVFSVPGVRTVVVTITDSAGGSSVSSIAVSVIPTKWQGTSGPDNYTIRLDTSNTYLQFFANVPTTGQPTFSLIKDLVSTVTFLAGDGDDVLTIDLSNGNALPINGILFDGGPHDQSGELLRILCDGSNLIEYAPSPEQTGDGTITVDGQLISFTNVESLITHSPDTFKLTTQSLSDHLLVESPGIAQTRISGNSGAALTPVVVTNVNTLILDTGAIEADAGDDTITISASGLDPSKSQTLITAVGVGNNHLIVNGGITAIQTSSGSHNLGVTLNNATSITLNAGQELASLNINHSARATLVSPTRQALRLRNLNITANAVLDLASSDLIIQSDPDHKLQLLHSVESYIGSARNNPSGPWLGTGITSSAAIANGLTGLAALLNDRDQTAVPFVTYFDSQVVDINCILVKYTWNGDANLDGIINASDYFQVDSGFITQRKGHYNGDFNYDGAVNADDYFMIDSAFIGQTSRMSQTDLPKPLPLMPHALPSPKQDPVQPLLATLFSTQPVLA